MVDASNAFLGDANVATQIAIPMVRVAVASPPPAHRIQHDDVSWYGAVAFAIVVAVGAFAGGLLAGRTIRLHSASEKDGTASGTIAVSWFWFALGCGSLVAHALLVSHPVDETWAPDFDTTALFWAIFAVSGFLVPIVTDVTLPGGFGFKVARDVRSGYLKSTDLLGELARLNESWTIALNALLAFAASDEADAESVRSLLLDFLRKRSFEAIQWLGSDIEERRLAVWIYDEKARLLRFLHSNEIIDAETLEATFANGEGLLGAAFANNVPVNVDVAWRQPGYKRIRRQWPPKYNGLLLLPIQYGRQTIGMLSVDRTAAEPFPATQASLFSALAAAMAVAIEDPRVKALLDARF